MSSETSFGNDWSGELAITGLGLITPVGLRAEASLAALRAGVSRLSRLSQLVVQVDENEMDLVIGAEAPIETERRMITDRIFLLMEPALKEVFSSADLGKDDRIGAYIGTPGASPGGRMLNYDEYYKENFLRIVPKEFRIEQARLVPAGRVSVLKAIRYAADALEKGVIDVAVIGASDSWINPRSLNWLKKTGRVNEYPAKTGTLPSEAAAFLTLEKPERVRERGREVYAFLKSSAGRFEEGNWGDPMNAIPLTHCIRSVTGDVQDEDAFVISDLCGERYRAMEWVMALPKAMWDYQNLYHWHPAECIGDSGSAMGAITLAWAAEAMRKQYNPSPNSLVWGASDEGYREAALVSAFRDK